jgi:hypothetical protein
LVMLSGYEYTAIWTGLSAPSIGGAVNACAFVTRLNKKIPGCREQPGIGRGHFF